MSGDFDRVPKDVIALIALELNFPNIITFCKSSKRFKNVVCKSDSFWINKLRKDYKVEFNRDEFKTPMEHYKYLDSIPKINLEALKEILPNYLQEVPTFNLTNLNAIYP